jgi:hypothetical protein
MLRGSLSPTHGDFSDCGRMIRLQIWKVAANISNKQSRVAYKSWASRSGVGHGGNTSQ